MTSRERVLRTFAFEKTDRVPVSYGSNPAVHGRLATAIGLKPDDWEGVRQYLGDDFRPVWTDYKGPQLFPGIPERHIDPVDGYRMRYIANDFGGYWDFCDFPLADAPPDVIANWPVPSPDDFDYSRVAALVASHGNHAINIGNAGVGDIINSLGRLMGQENILIAMADRDEAVLRLIDRRHDLQIGCLDRVMQIAGDRIDFLWLGEDLGTQIAPIVSMEMYRELLKPRHQRFVDFAKSYSLPVMIHTCGCSSWVYEEFVGMGFNAVDTLQPEARNMSPRYLKDNFGGRLAFHGCISTAGTLVTGTVDDIRKTVRDTLDIMAPGVNGQSGGGYMLAPSHSIQDNTPVENILAMYDEARKYQI